MASSDSSHSHSRWLSTSLHPPISSYTTQAVLTQHTARATGFSTRVLQHAHSRRSGAHSRSNGTTATPIHLLYSPHSPLTNAPMQSQHSKSKSSTIRCAPSPLAHHHSTSMCSSDGNATAAEAYTRIPGHLRQPSPSIPPPLTTSHPPASFRNTSGSRPPMTECINNNAPGALPLRLMRKNSSISPGVFLADSFHPSSTAGQVQRVDVKRLMSKPRAVQPPSSISSHPILPVLAHRAGSTTNARARSSLSDDETASRKASVHPLNVERQLRRSRTMDEIMLTSSIPIPVRPPQVNPATSSTMAPTTPTTPTIPVHDIVFEQQQAAGPSSTGGTTALMASTVRPEEIISTTAASTDHHVQRTTIWLDTPGNAAMPRARHGASLDLHRTTNLTPASALALAWNGSQRQSQPSPDSSFSHLPLPPPSPGKTLPLAPYQSTSGADTCTDSQYGRRTPSGAFDSFTRGGKVVAVGGPEDTAGDPYRMWAVVEEKLRQTARIHTSGNRVKELKRRVTGRFSRKKDKNKEREKEEGSESMGTFPPNAYPAESSRPGVPQRRRTEHDINKHPAEGLMIPQPIRSSLTAPSSMMSRKSWGDVTNASNLTVTESGSYKSRLTPTGSAMDVNHNEHTHSPHPSVPGSESSHTPAASLQTRSKSPAPSREGDTGKLWRLVRKLSNGALRQRLANEQGDTSVAVEEIPPVPALPEDFELVDHHAYVSGRDREHVQANKWVVQQHVASLGPVENSGAARTHSTFTMQSSPILSSTIGQLSIPVLPTSPRSISPVSSPLSTMSNVRSQHVMANINALSPYTPRSKHTAMSPAHEPRASQHSITTSGKSTSISGNEFSFRSNSPGFSSSVASDVTSSKFLTSPYSRRSSVSSNSELHTMAVAVGRPIIAPEELFRIRQEEFFARQAQSDIGHGGASSGRVQPRGPRIHLKSNDKGSVVSKSMLSYSTSPPPPSSSPVAAHPLPAPPRRKTLGNAPFEQVRLQATHGRGSPARSEQASSRAKSAQYPPISRPLSSPLESPLIPSFTNDRPANMYDDHPTLESTRPTSVWQSSTAAPSSPSSSSTGDSLSPRSRLGSLSSVNALSPLAVRRRVAKSNGSMHHDSSMLRHIEGNMANLSASARNSFPTLDDHTLGAELDETAEKGKRLRLNTSNSLLARVRSRSVKSSGALQTPESSSSAMTSKTAPARLSYKGKQRERSKSYVEVGGSRAPPMPFTATAFAFRELHPDSPLDRPVLTEQEREDRWAALLARSDRAGGTLTAKLEGGVLLSDAISIAEE